MAPLLVGLEWTNERDRLDPHGSCLRLGSLELRVTQQTLSQTEATLIQAKAELMKGVRLLDAVIEAHADVTEAGSWSGAGNGSVSGGRKSFDASDRTGDVASSPAHAYMRRQAKLIAEKGPELRRAMKPVTKIIDGWEKVLVRAIPVALDSETRERMQIADEADRDYRSRHAHKG
jgi:type IV secretory pathway TrbL component